jgi:thioredoxin 1
MNRDIQMSSDDELEAIKKKKLADLQKEAATKAMVHTLNEPIILTDSNFASEVRKNPLMIVDFWAPWCGPCRMVSPIIEQLAREYSGKVTVGKVNVDENQRIASAFGIQSIPTLMIFKNGKAVDIIIGAVPKSQIEMKLKLQLSKNNDSIYK